MDQMVNVFLMGKKYEGPARLTIMKALEYAGYKLVRGGSQDEDQQDKTKEGIGLYRPPERLHHKLPLRTGAASMYPSPRIVLISPGFAPLSLSLARRRLTCASMLRS